MEGEAHEVQLSSTASKKRSRDTHAPTPLGPKHRSCLLRTVDSDGFRVGIGEEQRIPSRRGEAGAANQQGAHHALLGVRTGVAATRLMAHEKNSEQVGRSVPAVATGNQATKCNGAFRGDECCEATAETQGRSQLHCDRYPGTNSVVHGTNHGDETKMPNMGSMANTQVGLTVDEMASARKMHYAGLVELGFGGRTGNYIAHDLSLMPQFQARSLSDVTAGGGGRHNNIAAVPNDGEAHQWPTNSGPNNSPLLGKIAPGSCDKDTLLNEPAVNPVLKFQSLITWPKRGTEPPTESELRDFGVQAVQVPLAKTLEVIKATGPCNCGLK